MNRKDFNNIMNNGFMIKYKGIKTELRCFKCGLPSKEKRIWGKWKMVCNNNHKYNLINFLVLHIKMRDSIAKENLERGNFENDFCEFEKPYEDFNNESCNY